MIISTIRNPISSVANCFAAQPFKAAFFGTKAVLLQQKSPLFDKIETISQLSSIIANVGGFFYHTVRLHPALLQHMQKQNWFLKQYFK